MIDWKHEWKKLLGIEKVKGVRCTEGQVKVVVAKAKETLADRK